VDGRRAQRCHVQCRHAIVGSACFNAWSRALGCWPALVGRASLAHWIQAAAGLIDVLALSAHPDRA